MSMPKLKSEIVDGNEIVAKPTSPTKLKKQLSSYYENVKQGKPGIVSIKSKYYPGYAEALPTMEGKVVAITGCTSGCGLVMARTVIEKKATLVALNRPSSRCTLALSQLTAVAEARGAPAPVVIDCDLTSFESVRKAGALLVERFGESGIDVLCNNAGVMGFTDDATEDGCDVQMQVNHTSHFLLTSLAMPCLDRAAVLRGEARIVNHSSALRALPEKGWDSHLKAKYLEKNGGKLGGNTTAMVSGPNYQRYQQSKLANVVFTYALHDRLTESGSKVKALVAHPGVAPTALHFSAAIGGDAPAIPLPQCAMNCFFKMLMHSEEDGTMGILKCACEPDAKSGTFYGPFGKGLVGGKHDQASYKGPAVEMPQETLADREAREMLWRVSEEVTGCKFNISHPLTPQTPA